MNTSVSGSQGPEGNLVDNGKPWYPAQISSKDTRPQKGNRNQLSSAFLNGIPDPAWMKDKNGVFLAVNLAWTNLIGKTPQEAIGKTDIELFEGKLGKTLHDQDLGILRSGKPKQLEEYFTVNGRLVWTDTIITPYIDETGAPAGIIGIARNITQRKQMEERFLRTQRMESLGALASGIAHDLNNILGPILMSASMLEENIKDPSNRELVNIIHEAAQRGAEIVNQVLTFARGTKGEREPLDPRLLVMQVERILRKIMPKNITFLSKLAPDLSNITGDATQLHQVFMNLCVNARDAMSQGGILSITGRNVEIDQNRALHIPNAHPGHFVCLAVGDTGIGISAEIREKIFDPFFTTKAIGKGTGLGLSTALAVVKNHGGFVTLETEVGKGSLFSIYLPATQNPSIPTPTPEPPSSLPSGHGELILVVDDELPICKMVETILVKKGYQVLSAQSGREALGLFAANRARIRAVLTDLAMPIMSGIEVIKALKTTAPGLPIIASTGQSSEHRYRELISLEVPWHLSKPYSAQQLLCIIGEAVASQRGKA